MIAPDAEQRTAELKELLTHLQKCDANKAVFGADWHGYKLNPVASADQVADFETRHRITLPEDYRAYLMRVGDGGAGPFYGILPLLEAAHESKDLHAEFPFVKRSRANRDVPGYVAVAHEGCGYYHVLVVSGPERGQMWLDARAGEPGEWTPLRCDFYTWYRKWAADALARITGHR